MAYDRYGVTVETARELSRDQALTDDDLEAAEADLVDLVLAYTPTDDGGPIASAFGRAVVWQAAHRSGLDGDADGTEVSRESYPDYTVDYVEGRGPSSSPVSPRAYSILTTRGVHATSGFTGPSVGRTVPRDPWTVHPTHG